MTQTAADFHFHAVTIAHSIQGMSDDELIAYGRTSRPFNPNLNIAKILKTEWLRREHLTDNAKRGD